MKRAKHSLSHYKLLTGTMGNLYPIGCIEALPGDSIQQSTSCLIRALPLNSPVMHPVTCRIHHWFVPFRLLWAGWEDFITGGPDGIGGAAGAYPTITTPGSPGVVESSLADYLGIPTGLISTAVAAFPFRAYALIFNEHYRDEDLVTKVGFTDASGADSTTNTTLQRIAWEKDQFTAARPWPQKGPAVTLPLGTSATVKTSPSALVTGAQTGLNLTQADGGAMPAARALAVGTTGGVWHATTNGGLTFDEYVYPNNLYADMSTATAVDVNTVREAFALQRYQEARSRYGSRYVEYLRYLGVRSSDARLQRPEYLGGGKQTIAFSEVLQTGVTTSGTSTGVGTLRGHGIAAMRSNRYRRFFEEHGLVMTMLSVRPRTMYPDGLERMWSRRTKEDYWQKELELIGQEEVYKREAYAKDSTPNAVFGYNDRYYSYRHNFSKISGAFRSTLDFWHMGRLFGSDIALNASFVNCNPSSRVFQVTSGDNLLVMASHSIQARRFVTKNPTARII